MYIEQLKAEQFPLAAKFYKQARYSSKVSKQDEVYVLRRTANKEIVATLRLSQLDQHLFLRSMVVTPDARRQQLGSQLLFQLVPYLTNRECWCFPYEHLVAFYQQINFEQFNPDLAPAAIRHKFQQYTQHGKKLVIMRRPV